MTALRRCAWTAPAVIGLSVSGHLFGGGAPPSVAALLIVGILGTVLAALVAISPRQPRTLTLVTLFGAFQVISHGVLHEVTTAGSVHLHVAGIAAHGAHLGHPGALGHTGPTVALASTPAGVMAGHGLSPLMLTTHLLATVLLAWVLGPAVRQVRHIVRRSLPTIPVLGRRVSHPVCPVLPRRRPTRDVQAATGLRGPPRLACA